MEGVKRPRAKVLPESALVSGGTTVYPAPNQFTHRVTRELAFFFGTAAEGKKPDGHLAPGTKVVLMTHNGGERCRVIDGKGRYVETEYDGLAKL